MITVVYIKLWRNGLSSIQMGQSLCGQNDQQDQRNIKYNKTNSFKDLPYKCIEILKSEDYYDVSNYCMDKLYEILYTGIPLERMLNNRTPKKKSQGTVAKYWVDRETKKNCFMLFPRHLSVEGGDDGRKWSWKRFEERRDLTYEIAVMEGVESLSVRGNFGLEWLTPETTYKVVFVLDIRRDKPPSGWNTTIRTTLLVVTHNNPQRQIKNVDFNELVRSRSDRLEIEIGAFVNPLNSDGVVQFFLQEKEDSDTKTGLIIQGVKILPLPNEID